MLLHHVLGCYHHVVVNGLAQWDGSQFSKAELHLVPCSSSAIWVTSGVGSSLSVFRIWLLPGQACCWWGRGLWVCSLFFSAMDVTIHGACVLLGFTDCLAR